MVSEVEYVLREVGEIYDGCDRREILILDCSAKPAWAVATLPTGNLSAMCDQ